MKKHIITIAGRPGSGKSSVTKAVAQKLGYDHFSSGDLFRKLAGERGIELLKANLSTEENSELDHLVDGRLREIGEQEGELVIDSRTAWHWIPKSFKVFLDLDLEVAAQRIIATHAHRNEANEDIPKDTVIYAGILKQRLDSENRRYKNLYDIDPNDKQHYDLVVDTAANNISEVVDQIVQQYKVWLAKD